jgi:hypothetical protein
MASNRHTHRSPLQSTGLDQRRPDHLRSRINFRFLHSSRSPRVCPHNRKLSHRSRDPVERQCRRLLWRSLGTQFIGIVPWWHVQWNHHLGTR